MLDSIISIQEDTSSVAWLNSKGSAGNSGKPKRFPEERVEQLGAGHASSTAD